MTYHFREKRKLSEIDSLFGRPIVSQSVKKSSFSQSALSKTPCFFWRACIVDARCAFSPLPLAHLVSRLTTSSLLSHYAPYRLQAGGRGVVLQNRPLTSGLRVVPQRAIACLPARPPACLSASLCVCLRPINVSQHELDGRHVPSEKQSAFLACV